MSHISRFVAIFEADIVKDISLDPHVAKKYEKSQSYLLVGTSTRQLLHDKCSRGIPGMTTLIQSPGYVTEHAHAIEDIASGMLAHVTAKWGNQIQITYVSNVGEMVEALQKNLDAETAEKHPEASMVTRRNESLQGHPALLVQAI